MIHLIEKIRKPLLITVSVILIVSLAAIIITAIVRRVSDRSVFLSPKDFIITKTTRLTLDSPHSANDYFPVWAYNESKIIFTSDRTGIPALWIMNADGTELEKFFTDSSQKNWFLKTRAEMVEEKQPHFSDKTEILAYTENNNIFTFNTDTKRKRQITFNGRSQLPQLSPDGEKIAYVSKEGGNFHIFVAALSGTQPVRNTTKGASDNGAFCWSPDSKKIAFTSTRDGNVNIYEIDIETEELIQLTDSEDIQTSPSYTSDGNFIAYIQRDNSHNNIYIMKSDGSEESILKSTSTDEYSPVWSKDGGKLLLYRGAEGSYDVWVYHLGIK